MAIKKFQTAGVPSLEDMTKKGSPASMQLALWCRANLETLLVRAGLQFDPNGSAVYPACATFSGMDADEKKAQGVAKKITKMLDVGIKPGFTSAMQPVALLTEKFTVGDKVKAYCVITLFKSGKLVVKVQV